MDNVIQIGNTQRGFTRMDNDLLDALALHDFTQTERKIIDVVVRLTAGYQRPTARIRGKEFAARTGKKANHISEALDALLRRNVLYRVGGSAGEIGVRETSAWEAKQATQKAGNIPNIGTEKVREIGHLIKKERNIAPTELVAAVASTPSVELPGAETQDTPAADQPASAKAERIPYAKIMEIYNRVCGGVLPSCIKLNPKRQRQIKECWNLNIEGGFPFREGEFWEAYFAQCLLDPHWIGKNDRGWKADIEFLTRQDKVLKVLEAV
jgi:phage replication O-like protein O